MSDWRDLNQHPPGSTAEAFQRLGDALNTLWSEVLRSARELATRKTS